MTKEQRNDREVAEIELGQIFSIVMIISITVVGAAYMINVMGDVKDDMGTTSCAARSDGFIYYNTTSDMCYNSTSGHTAVLGAEYNASVDGITAVAKFPTKMTLVATIVVAVIIITLLTRYFRF